MSDKVMIVGGGGREHALGWHIAQSPEVGEIYQAHDQPNAGIAQLSKFADFIPVNYASNYRSLIEAAKNHNIDFVIVGPDEPLAGGLVDRFRLHDIPAFGPYKSAARLEWDKTFAHEFMRSRGVPTPYANSFTYVDNATDYMHSRGRRNITAAEHAMEYLRLRGWRNVVIKANGLAKGKGVTVLESQNEAEIAIVENLIQRKFGAASDTIQVQDRVKDKELSVFAIADGERAVLLPSFRDFKRLKNRNRGPNTGGMGAYGPVKLGLELEAFIQERIAQPIIDGMREDDTPYLGVLYLGLMLTEDGPTVIEINSRFGDPETQALVMSLDENLYPLMRHSVEGNIQQDTVAVKSGTSMTVALAADGYPETHRTGDLIHGIARVEEGVEIFQAGTQRDSLGRLKTNGGRVLHLATHAETIERARENIYFSIGKRAVHFGGMQYRSDIGLTT